MKLRALVVVLLASFRLFSPPCQAQRSATGSDHGGRNLSISGMVRYQENETGADQVKVDLRVSSDALLDTIVTNSMGGFEFRGLGAGTYFLTINEPGFEPISEPVELSDYSRRGVNLYLKRLASAAPAERGSTVSSHELSVSEKARAAMQEGKDKLYQTKDPRGSLAAFKRAVAEAPGYYEAYEQMGMAYLELGQPGDAEKSFRKSIELSGDKYARADFDLSYLLSNQQLFADAEKVARHGLELEPKNWLGQYALGRSLLGMNRIADAKKSAEECRSLKPDFPMVYRLLANIYIRLHDSAALLEDLDAYIKLDPDSPAGARAKELREHVQQTLGRAKSKAAAAPASTKP